jgi:hypothetical protein
MGFSSAFLGVTVMRSRVSRGSRRLVTRRRGGAYVQWILIASAIFAGLLIAWANMGTQTSARMDKIAEGVGDPTKLTKQFGS